MIAYGLLGIFSVVALADPERLPFWALVRWIGAAFLAAGLVLSVV